MENVFFTDTFFTAIFCLFFLTFQQDINNYLRIKLELTLHRNLPNKIPRWKYPYVALPPGEILLPSHAGDRSLTLSDSHIKIIGSRSKLGSKIVGEIIVCKRTRNLLLKNLSLQNRTGTGIKISHGSQATLVKVQVKSCCLSAIHCTSYSSVTVRDCDLSENGKTGITLRRHSKCYVHNTCVTKNNSDGLCAYDKGSEIHISVAPEDEVATSSTSSSSHTPPSKAKVRENSGHGINTKKEAITFIHSTTKTTTSNGNVWIPSIHSLKKIAHDNRANNFIGTRSFSPLPMKGFGDVGKKRKRVKA